MNFKEPLDINDILEIVDGKVLGESPIPITGINEIHKVRKGDLSYVDHPKYFDKLLNSDASYILINQAVEPPDGKTIIVVDDPFETYNTIVKKYFPWTAQNEMINSQSVIHEEAVLQPGVFIGPDVSIGKNSIIYSGVQLLGSVHIGENCIIQSGTVIGSEAFYYHREGEVYTRMNSCGRVMIEDDVEIGALCSIDRGVSGDTIIGQGTKIDNHVHIGHGVVIGKNCILAAQVGVAGKTHIGNDVKLWGQVGVNKSLTIGDHAEVYAQSGVAGSLEGGKKYFGSPAEDARTKMKELRWVKRIEEIWEKLNKIG